MAIRTPRDEIDKLDYYYLPFQEGDWYEGQTYGGHTDFSVDWNRRRKNGAWLEDEGQPVFAAANGKVSGIESATGTVFIDHWGGVRRTESRHMRKVMVKLGQRVLRGDQIGEIGKVGISPGSGFVPSAHLHHVHWKKEGGVWKRCKQSFYGKDVISSVWNSDSTPAGTNMPGPVLMQGPPARATWESAFKESEAAREKTTAALAKTKLELEAAEKRIEELTANPPDCSTQEAALAAAIAEIATLNAALASVDAIVHPLIKE